MDDCVVGGAAQETGLSEPTTPNWCVRACVFCSGFSDVPQLLKCLTRGCGSASRRAN